MSIGKLQVFFCLLFTSFISAAFLQVQAQTPFTWDNATVYFVLTDRFYNGDANNDFPYSRTSDPIGGFQGGDLKGMTEKITEGYFDDLGVNALWITAPYEQIHGHVPGYGDDDAFQKHYAYHGYYALDFTEVDDNMGSFDDFEALVDTAHAHGIRVIMDIVLNHVGYDNEDDSNEFNLGEVSNPNDPDWCNWWTDDNDVAWIRKGDADEYCSPAGGGDDLTLPLAGLPDIRTDYTDSIGIPKILQTKWNATKESQEITELQDFFEETNLTATPANHIIKWLTDWVREYGVDGFRIDTYKHVERSVWGELKDQAEAAFAEWKTNNPNKKLDDNPFWMVGEWYGHGPGKNTDAVVNGKTDALINFNFQGIAGNPQNMESTYSNYASIVNPDPEWNILSYISSHDTDLFDRNDLIDAGTSMFLLPGAVQIFYGDETARPFLDYNTNSDQDTRSFMNWGSKNQSVLTHWQKMGKFRQEHPAIGAGTHQLVQASNPYIFTRSYQDSDLGICDFIAAAIGTNTGSVTLDVTAIFEEGAQIRNAYTGDVATVTNGGLTFNVGSEALILMEYVTSPPCLTVEISPDVCHDDVSIEVSITATDGDNPDDPPTIYYSFNANASPENLSDWTVYSVPFTLNQSETVYAFAKNTNNENSKVVSQSYTIGEEPSMTLYWNADNANCNTPYVYLWEMDGVADSEVAPWPGVAMTESSIEGWYEYTLNACFSNVIFSCNGGSQTADLFAEGNACYDGGWTNCPNFGAAASISPASGNFPTGSVEVTLSASNNACQIYYTSDGSTPSNENGTLYANPFTVNGSPSSPVTVKAIAYCNDETSAVETAVYTFDTNSLTLRWNPQGSCNTPYLYYWNIDGETNNPVAWPGVLMTNEDGDDWYEYTIADADCANVIFNCGSSQNQTGDLLNICEDACFQGNTSSGTWITCPDFGEECPAFLELEGDLESDTYSASGYIEASGNIAANKTVIFEAETYIDLLPNFSADFNSVFSTEIKTCSFSPVVAAKGDLSTDKALAETPSSLQLKISPNPFQHQTKISFFLPKDGEVRLSVFDTQGRLLTELPSQSLQKGWRQTTFEVGNLGAGVYVLLVQTEGTVVSERVVVY